MNVSKLANSRPRPLGTTIYTINVYSYHTLCIYKDTHTYTHTHYIMFSPRSSVITLCSSCKIDLVCNEILYTIFDKEVSIYFLRRKVYELSGTNNNSRLNFFGKEEEKCVRFAHPETYLKRIFFFCLRRLCGPMVKALAS